MDGMDGTDGSDGQDGAAGAAGAQGLTGAAGADGQDGADGSIEQGTKVELGSTSFTTVTNGGNNDVTVTRDPAEHTTVVVILDETSNSYRRHFYFEANSYRAGDLIIGKDHRSGAPASGTWGHASYSVQRIDSTTLRLKHSHGSLIDPFTLTVFEIPTGAKGDQGDQGPAGTGEANVQADWDEGDSSDDAYIQNKPSIPSTFSDLTGEIVTSQIADDAVTGDKVASNTVHGGSLVTNTIPTDKYGDGTVTNVKIDGMDASKLTGTIDDARIPADIARDSELPAANRLIPSGGATAQQLAKATATDYDVEWADPVSANPSGTPSNQLLKVSIGGSNYQVRSTHSVLNLSDRPSASAATVGHIYYVLSKSQAYIGVNDAHTVSVSDGDFDAIPSRSDFHIVTSLPTQLNNLAEGDFYYWNSRSIHQGGAEFYEIQVIGNVNHLVQVSAGEALEGSTSVSGQNVEWLGDEATTVDALEYTYTVSSNTDYFWFDPSDSTIKILDQSTFDGAGVTTNHYQWRGIGGEAATYGVGTVEGELAALGSGGEFDTARLPTVPVSKGGTGSTSASDAKTALGVGFTLLIKDAMVPASIVWESASGSHTFADTDLMMFSLDDVGSTRTRSLSSAVVGFDQIDMADKSDGFIMTDLPASSSHTLHFRKNGTTLQVKRSSGLNTNRCYSVRRQQS